MDSEFVLISSDSSSPSSPSEVNIAGKVDVCNKAKNSNIIRAAHSLSDSDSSDAEPTEAMCLKDKFSYELSNELSDSSDDSLKGSQNICGSFESNKVSTLETINSASQTSQSPEKNSVGRRPRLTAEVRYLEKEKKAKERKEKDAARKILKQMRPGECIKFIKVVVDVNLVTTNYYHFIDHALEEYEAKSIVETQTVPMSVTWIRDPGDEIYQRHEEPLAIIIWHHKEFLDYIKNDTLHNKIRKIQEDLPNKNITLIITGLGNHLRSESAKRRKSKGSGKSKLNDSGIQIDKKSIEMELVRLQLELDCDYRIIDAPQEVGMVIAQFTKSVAETPFRKEKARKEHEMAWLASSDSRDCVRVDKAGNGLSQLWQQQLMQFNNCNLAIIQAIVTRYPTPQSLMKAYQACMSAKDAESLLRDITIRRGGIGDVAAVRKIGPELSKKLYIFFTSRDTNFPLSQTP